LLTPPPTGPTFNVFILLPRLARLQIAAVDGTVQVSWPTNSGHWVLQSRTNSADDEGWINDTNTPGVRGDRYVVTNSVANETRFYRLRSW